MAVLQTITFYIHNLRDAILSDVRGWVICACVLLITVVRSGITYSFGVFVVKLEATYHRPLAEQNWIGTLSFCISLSFAPLSVAFIRALRYRGYWLGGIMGTIILTTSCMASSLVRTMEWLFLTHSLLYGVGSSLIYMASSLVIGEYFDKEHRYHVLATSILLCGYPIGSLLFNPINAWLVTRFGWRVAFRFASVLILFTGLGTCWTFKSRNTPNMQRLEEEPEDDSKSPPPTPLNTQQQFIHDIVEESKASRHCCTLAEVKEKPEIVLWYMGNLLSYLGFFMPFLNLAYYMELKGIPPTKSSWALTLLSFAECCTYIIASFLGDWFKGRLVYVNVIASLALSFICIIWPFVDVNYTIICLIALAMGGFLGLTIVYTYAASGEVTGLPIDMAWSFTNLWSGVGILIGPFFSGAIYDWRKSYDDVFYIVGVLYFFDCLIFGAIPGLDKWRAKQKSKLDYNEIQGVVGDQQKQTFRITKGESLSRSSLVNGDTEAHAYEYGTTGSTDAPPRPPPPSEQLIRQNSRSNSFKDYE